MQPKDIKGDVRLSNMKPLHAKLIVRIYNHLKQLKSLVFPGFRKGGITDAVRQAQSLVPLSENRFIEMEIVHILLFTTVLSNLI